MKAQVKCSQFGNPARNIQGFTNWHYGKAAKESRKRKHAVLLEQQAELAEIKSNPKKQTVQISMEARNLARKIKYQQFLDSFRL